jgi:transposase
MSKNPISLPDDQRTTLQRLIRSGTAPARKLTHARILLKADQGLGDGAIAEALDISLVTAWRVRRRFREEGFDSALDHKHPTQLKPPRLDGRAEARLITLACSTPPEGRARWSLRLLAEALVESELVPHIAPETVRKALKKTNCVPI